MVLDVVHGGTTILLPNESFGLAYFPYDPDFAQFYEGASRAVADALKKGGGLKLEKSDDDRLHFTTIPWVSFTSFSHARNWKREESATKIAFGKFSTDDHHTWLPISVEVHHALMDGLHVGRFLEQVQNALLNPAHYLRFEQPRITA